MAFSTPGVCSKVARPVIFGSDDVDAGGPTSITGLFGPDGAGQ